MRPPVSARSEPVGEVVVVLESLRAVPKERPRLGAGHVYTPRRTAAFAAAVRMAALPALRGAGPFRGAVAVDASIVQPIPKSWPKAARAQALDGARLPTGKPDLDNLVKNVLDALVGVVFRDDRQIVDLACRKRYGERALVELRFRSIPHGSPERCGTSPPAP